MRFIKSGSVDILEGPCIQKIRSIFQTRGFNVSSLSADMDVAILCPSWQAFRWASKRSWVNQVWPGSKQSMRCSDIQVKNMRINKVMFFLNMRKPCLVEHNQLSESPKERNTFERVETALLEINLSCSKQTFKAKRYELNALHSPTHYFWQVVLSF